MRRYNRLKREVLATLASQGWRRPKELALALGYGADDLYGYMARLKRWGLVHRRELPFVEYTLSERGRERLAWLSEASERPTFG